MIYIEACKCESAWKGETQLRRLLGSLVPLVGMQTLGNTSASERAFMSSTSADGHSLDTKPVSLHALFMYVIGQRKDSGHDSLRKGQHVFPQHKILLNKYLRHVRVEARIGGRHGRGQRRVCTDLGGRIQPISGENQEASFSLNIGILSRVRLRIEVSASGHADKAFAPITRGFADSTEPCRDLKGDPILTNLWTTDDLLRELERQDQQFQGFREKKAKLWEALRRSMLGVEVLGGLTQNALTLTPFSMASPVLGAVLFLVGSAKGVSEAYDDITILLSKLEDFTGRLQEYTRAAVDPKLKKKVVEILTTLLEVFARAEKLIKKGRPKQYMSVTFLGSNEKIVSAMTRLNSLIDTEDRLVGSLVYSTVLRTNETVGRSEKTVERNEKALQGVSGSLTGEFLFRGSLFRFPSKTLYILSKA